MREKNKRRAAPTRRDASDPYPSETHHGARGSDDKVTRCRNTELGRVDVFPTSNESDADSTVASSSMPRVFPPNEFLGKETWYWEGQLRDGQSAADKIDESLQPSEQRRPAHVLGNRYFPPNAAKSLRERGRRSHKLFAKRHSTRADDKAEKRADDSQQPTSTKKKGPGEQSEVVRGVDKANEPREE